MFILDMKRKLYRKDKRLRWIKKEICKGFFILLRPKKTK